MGRKVPNDPSQPFHHTLLSIPLLLSAMAAVMAIASILCGVRSRRKSESATSTTTDKPQERNTNMNTNPNSPLSSSPPGAAAGETVLNNPGEQTEAAVIEIVESSSSQLPENEPQKNQITTAKKTPGTFSSTSLLAKSASTRNLAKNLSMKMTRSISMAGRDLQDRMKIKGKLKPEDSVWMKTIILGEKCKVNDGEEAIIYERKGNKIAAYHPKTSTGGLIDQNGIIRSQQNGDQPKDFSE